MLMSMQYVSSINRLLAVAAEEAYTRNFIVVYIFYMPIYIQFSGKSQRRKSEKTHKYKRTKAYKELKTVIFISTLSRT